jgi:hypothetical protein
MKKLAIALAATAALAFTAPAFAASDAPMKVAQAEVKVKIGEGREHRGMERREGRMHMERREVRMHRDRDWHEGRRHHRQGDKVVIIKKRMHRD